MWNKAQVFLNVSLKKKEGILKSSHDIEQLKNVRFIYTTELSRITVNLLFKNVIHLSVTLMK